MKIGDQYSRKDYEYTVVSVVKHKTKEHVDVYMIERRKYGYEEVDYFVQEYNFSSPAFRFEGNIHE
jgi:hypothetical protein